MPADFFQFKQFRVHQDSCGMKVTTDACIFGAWVPVRDDAKRALDVGAGTALLSLMLAQRFPNLEIDAVEIDAEAAAQAAQNVAASRFADRIHVIHADARESSRLRQEYDILVCNPPFFSKSLQSPETGRNAARHDVSLSQHDLLVLADRCLKPDGQLAILLPLDRQEEWLQAARANGWNTSKQLLIQSMPEGMPSRFIAVLQREKMAAACMDLETLTVYQQHNTLTPAAAKLLQPFYLRL